MSQDTLSERLRRLRLIAGSSIVGGDVKWLLDEYERLYDLNEYLQRELTRACQETRETLAREVAAARAYAQWKKLNQRLSEREVKPIDIEDVGSPHLREDV